MHSEILKPVVVLIAWTLVMLLWMMLTRLPAMKASGVDLNTLVGTKPADADGRLPPKVQWKAHNYNHLMEQPTLFYAVCGVIALTGTGNGVNAWIAWAYVLLRIAHSVWQATVNKVSVRFALFLGSSLALVALTLHAAMAVFA
ncbi:MULTISPECIES: MAPEG family protein [Sphingomonas]|uniref:MAPEG family protein n=1 Tax=Sphingomonas TaxID=13687 RepID=UPI002413ABAD|nr:MAPEG family protein [Sphingomonas echinoides]